MPGLGAVPPRVMTFAPLVRTLPAAGAALLLAGLLGGCASSGRANDDDLGASGTFAVGAGPGSTGTGVSSSAAASGTGDPSTGVGGATGVGPSGTGGDDSGAGGAGSGGEGGGQGGQGGGDDVVASSTASGGTPLGPPDNCGFASDGVWFEIDYGSAYTVTNPSWKFSATAGFGEPQWAPSGSSWPEVWHVSGGSSTSSDPIGTVASVGPSSYLQIMLGLTGLSSYSHATVCVEGRSISTSSSVTFDVFNPLNGCGVTAQMSHSWEVHKVAIDLGDCMIEGEDFQALRIDPVGGSSRIGIRRVRLTLHDAVY